MVRANLSGGALASCSMLSWLLNAAVSSCLLSARRLAPSGTGTATFIQLDYNKQKTQPRDLSHIFMIHQGIIIR